MAVLVEKDQFLNTYKLKSAGIRAFNNYKHWFPVCTSATLAGIVADITSDGSLQEMSLPRFDFISGNLDELKRFEEELYKLFKIRGYVQECNTNPYGKSYFYRVNCHALGRILHLCGVPVGCKVKTEFDVPLWIKGGSSKIKRRYLKRAFTCEGHVKLQKQKRIIIGIKYFKAIDLQDDLIKFMTSIKNMLQEYDIKSTNLFRSGKVRRKDGVLTEGIAIEIQGTKNNMQSIINFKKYIDFDGVKNEKLNRYINSIILPLNASVR